MRLMVGVRGRRVCALVLNGGRLHLDTDVVRRIGPTRAFAAAREVTDSVYLRERGLHLETLRDPRFAGTWRQDARGNVLFAHRDDASELTGFEIKNRGVTRFAPGGTKSAWQSGVHADDCFAVVTESAIEALRGGCLHLQARFTTPRSEAAPTNMTSGLNALQQESGVKLTQVVHIARDDDGPFASSDEDDRGVDDVGSARATAKDACGLGEHLVECRHDRGRPLHESAGEAPGELYLARLGPVPPQG